MLRRYIQPAVAQPNHKNMHLSLSSSFRSSPFSSGEASLYPDAEKILLDHYGDSTRRNIRKWCCRKFIRIDTRRRSTYSGVYLPDKTYVRYTYIWIGSWLNPAQERFVTRKKKKKKEKRCSRHRRLCNCHEDVQAMPTATVTNSWPCLVFPVVIPDSSEHTRRMSSVIKVGHGSGSRRPDAVDHERQRLVSYA